MRLTVGPLPPAVYWRRRAVVLGSVLAFVLLLTYSCSGRSGADNRDKQAKETTSSAPAGSPPSATATPGPSVLAPTGPEPSFTPPVYGSVESPGDGGAGSASGTPCVDSEIAVSPTMEVQAVQQGTPVKFFIKIKNVSSRTCVRDVGSQMQELYVQQGGGKQWSSDLCENRGRTADVVAFPAGHERSYSLTWDGKANAQGCANQPWLAKGTYQLVARVGTKISDPITFAITA
jgi:hypothetical protein